jgi:iron complex outermembrane receptor protein
MDDHTFTFKSLSYAVASARNSGSRVLKPIKQTAAILAVSSLGLTPISAIAADGALEEIIVTATRRDASLQDVSIPMTAVSGEALERHFAQDLRDLTNAAPNVQFEPVGIFQNASAFYIRGQGTGDIESASDGKVGIYVDGVVQARVSTALSDMVDVSAVEIIRGPQGTLFGRNTIAGAVQILHNEPKMNEWGGRISVQGGEYGRMDVKGTVNIPMIDDTLAGRIAFKSTEHDGYWKNDFVGKDRGATDRFTILPSLKWNVNDNLEIVARGEWSETDDDTNMTQSHHYCRDDPFDLFVTGAPDNDLVILTETLYNLVVLGQDPVTAAAGAASICAKPFGKGSVNKEWTAPNTEDRGQQYETDVWGVTVQADYEWNDWGVFTYIGSYREVEEDIIFTIDVSHHDLFAGQRIQEHYQFSNELRFASTFSDKFDFVVGAYQFEQEYEMKQSSWGMLFAPNIVLNAPDPTVITFTNPSSYGQAQYSTQLNEAWAVFAQGNWHVTDKLTLTVGGRYTDETKEFKHCLGVGDESLGASAASGAKGCNNSPAFVIDPTLPPIIPDGVVGGAATPVWQLEPAIGFDASGGVEGGCRPVLDSTGSAITCNNRLAPPEEQWDDFTPMGGVTYRFNDDLMVYFTYTEGFTAGGWNGRGGTETSIGPFEPEKGENYEIGIKSDWMGSRLRINATAFSTEVTDFQSAFIRPSPGGGGQETIQTNVGSYETEGVELELTYLATDNLTLWMNYSYLDTERKDFCTDPDGPHGTEDEVPTEGGPQSAGSPVCSEPLAVRDAVGNFVGWQVDVDVSSISQSARSPKYTLSAGFAYEWQLNDLGNLTLSADWMYADDQIIAGSRIEEPDGVLQYNGDFISHGRDSSDIFNASVTWRSPEGRYESAYFMKNITDESYNQATTNVATLLNFRNANIRRHWALEFRMNLGSI